MKRDMWLMISSLTVGVSLHMFVLVTWDLPVCACITRNTGIDPGISNLVRTMATIYCLRPKLQGNTFCITFSDLLYNFSEKRKNIIFHTIKSPVTVTSEPSYILNVSMFRSVMTLKDFKFTCKDLNSQQ